MCAGKKILIILNGCIFFWKSNKQAVLNKQAERSVFLDFFKQADPKSCVQGGKKIKKFKRACSFIKQVLACLFTNQNPKSRFFEIWQTI